MQLEDYQSSWNNKPVLQAIYGDLYQKITEKMVVGDTLEIGGGIGNLQVGYGKLIRSDIQCSAGVDVVTDAQKLSFKSNIFSNIVLFDVLHHLQCPLLFFAEAERVLAAGGRIILIEPGITPMSWFLYKLMHDELVDMGWKVDKKCVVDPNKDPYVSNQAIPTVMFKSTPELFHSEFPKLRIKNASWLSLFAYPLSGGFKSWSLISVRWARILLKIEKKLLPFFGSFMAFRLMVVIEKHE